MDSSSENRTVTLQRNPLLIGTVINRVFEYLPLEDLKQCRFVCREWNSVSIQILNKQSTVTLDSKERMTKFLELYKDYNTQPFPFTRFQVIKSRLSDSNTGWNTEKDYEQLGDEFNTLRENIITLIFVDRGGDRLYLTPLIEAASNLVTLTLLSCNSVVQLDKLSKVKYLSLTICRLSLDSFGKRIAPLSICLRDVTFERNENELQEILLNDYIDFGGCSEIEMTFHRGFAITFDMSRDIVSTRKVHFYGIRLINSRAAPEKVDKKMLPFEKYNGMRIRELRFHRSELNLSMLPKSLEKLSLSMNTYGSNNCERVELPNLKCLFFRPIFKAANNMSPTFYDMSIITSMFRLCPKLVDMELSGFCISGWRCDINVDLLPVTLKRIKLTDNININLVGDSVIHVDILIFNSGTFADAQKFMIKIKPKILVVALIGLEVEDPANEIVSFVEESRNLEKIVLRMPEDDEDNDEQLLKSYERTLSSYVDLEENDITSEYYEFTNQVVKRLTREEFNLYWFSLE